MLENIGMWRLGERVDSFNLWGSLTKRIPYPTGPTLRSSAITHATQAQAFDLPVGQKWGKPNAKPCHSMPIMHLCKHAEAGFKTNKDGLQRQIPPDTPAQSACAIEADGAVGTSGSQQAHSRSESQARSAPLNAFANYCACSKRRAVAASLNALYSSSMLLPFSALAVSSPKTKPSARSLARNRSSAVCTRAICARSFET